MLHPENELLAAGALQQVPVSPRGQCGANEIITVKRREDEHPGAGFSGDPFGRPNTVGAVYLGFTVSEGRGIIRRVDAWFAHRFAEGPEPYRVPKDGIERVRHEWKSWGRMVLTATIASAVLGAMILLVRDAERTAELVNWFRILGIATGVWLVGWPVWESVRYLVNAPIAKSRSHTQGLADRRRNSSGRSDSTSAGG